MSENVIDIRTATVKRRSFMSRIECQCMAIELDTETKLLACQNCGRYFSAFDWLLERVRAGQKFKFAEMELAKTRKEIAAKNVELRNLKQQINYRKRRLKGAV